LFRHYLEARTPPRRGTRTRIRRGEIPRFLEGLVEPGDTDADDASADAEEQCDESTRHDQEALVAVLRRAVPPRPIRWSSGYRSGTVIDLDRAMRAAATGLDGDRIWGRRRVEHPALAALLLVDLSGSMNGHKVEAAIAATRALSAALAQIRGVSWRVLGFQDRTIPVIGFNERAEPAAMARIDAMRAEAAGTRPGGNNQPRYNDDGPCLLEAAAELLARPERDRLLMVISDGSPEGKNSNRQDLHDAVAKVTAMPGTTLVGLGLGPGTEHVTGFYPTSRANLALEELAPAIGDLLASGLRRAAG
jgi:nitric oxide reductase activation protein